MAEAAQMLVSQKQKMVVTNNHGEKLVGLLHETGSREIVILCHGARASKDHFIIENLAVALEKQGISSFRFDFAGNGESEGAFQVGHLRREADDLHAVIQHFSGSNHVVNAIFGHSKGGADVLLYASKYHDIPTVVEASARYDLKKGIEKHLGKDFMEKIKKEGFIDIGSPKFRVTEESLMDILSTDMRESCLKIDKDCRVLTVHGSADEIVPVENAFEFAKIIPNHKIHIIEGADHCYKLHQAELDTVVVDFIKAALQQDKASSN
ncbi:putative feruloyl esterase [Rosa chinensis]|uniref:Putative feruloyl esterase n=1 Tax=Rosa chinensis TaxID=74649 RepID=A0A2P6RKB4_ROSCH|nr:uncharacterized protein LOC112187541 isoform X1 [Rosa chinensis]PRQ46857.1 putative feruloyl esterase [Rosa chinensis]